MRKQGGEDPGKRISWLLLPGNPLRSPVLIKCPVPSEHAWCNLRLHGAISERICPYTLSGGPHINIPKAAEATAQAKVDSNNRMQANVVRAAVDAALLEQSRLP